MRIAIFDAHRFERRTFESVNRRFGHELTFFEHRLTEDTAGSARGFAGVCAFVNDRLNERVLAALVEGGTRLVALRSAGYNHVDLDAAARLGLAVARVPAYSPHAVAEHAVAMILAMNRRICRASARVRELNFSLEGLVGFDLHGKTVGVVGTGKIGAVFAGIMRGFGCRLLAFDVLPDRALESSTGLRYADLDELLEKSDIVSLHVPLTPGTRHLLDDRAFARMKPGAMLINTGRGALVDSKALVRALKSGRLGFAGLDVYEEEEGVFFQDLSDTVLQDDVLARLMTFPNVMITSHQAFLTNEALENIAETTLANAADFEAGKPLVNEIRLSP